MKRLIIALITLSLISCERELVPNVTHIWEEGVPTSTGYHFHDSGYEVLRLDVHKAKAEIYYEGRTFISDSTYIDTLQFSPLIIKKHSFTIII